MKINDPVPMLWLPSFLNTHGFWVPKFFNFRHCIPKSTIFQKFPQI